MRACLEGGEAGVCLGLALLVHPCVDVIHHKHEHAKCRLEDTATSHDRTSHEWQQACGAVGSSEAPSPPPLLQLKHAVPHSGQPGSSEAPSTLASDASGRQRPPKARLWV